MAKCLNCDAELTGAFCPQCGQEASVSRLNLRQTLAHAVGHVVSLDSVVPRTIWGLTRNPGRLCREYVDGRRAVYVQPFRYCLTALALLMIVYAIKGSGAFPIPGEPGEALSPALQEFQAATMNLAFHHLNSIFLAALPLTALLMKGLYWRSRFNYSEIMSFLLYVMGHGFLLRAIIAAALPASAPLQLEARLGLQAVYLIWASIGFFGGNRLVVAIKSLVALAVNMLNVALVVMILLAPKLVSAVRQDREPVAVPTTVSAPTAALFVLHVADQQLSREFYAHALAMEPVLDVPGMTEFRLTDGATLGLMPEAGIVRLLGDQLPDPAFGTGTLRGEVYLTVDDPTACLARAVAAGARLVSACAVRDWGDMAGYCLDADGYLVAFAAPVAAIDD